MNKLIAASLTLGGVLLAPMTFANDACSPDNPSACKSKLEKECLYYSVDEFEMDEGLVIFEEGYMDYKDQHQGHDEEFKESDLLLSDLNELSLTSEQQSLVNEWQAYNTQFDKDWMTLCMSYPNKEKSITNQIDWEEANLKNDLTYLKESRVFVNKMTASLTGPQKQQLVQLGLMQLLP